jgi:hypothetical protein
MDVLKLDFGEDDEAMLEGVEWPFEIIFCIMAFEISD